MSSRLFVAAQLPQHISTDLARFVEPRRDADPRLSWSPEQQWHLTATFMGEVPDRVIEPLIDELSSTCADSPGFDVALGGAGCFGSPDAAKVLWLGLATGAEQFSALSRRCRTVANRVGAGPDSLDVPHLTLARARRIEAGRWLQILDTYRSAEWRLGELWLFESQLGRGVGGRAQHTKLAQLRLA